MKIRKDLENIGDMLTPKGFENLRVGQVLGFQKDDGQVQQYRIVLMNRRKKECWVKKTKLLTMEQLEAELAKERATESL